MEVIEGRNVHSIFPVALSRLYEYGVRRESRNGPVLQFPGAVTTVYRKPMERVLFWEDRDANPFFHLYEALWMLRGRSDVAGVARYATNMASYSDNGEYFHGAYGYRWRKHFLENNGVGIFSQIDQLGRIARALKDDPTDRRCVLQMWDVLSDLGKTGKDFPCNTIATFQINYLGELDLHVFCRSNDIVWGCYGANAVQFAFLLEYMAHWIGVPVGRYEQISINWHGYLDTLKKVEGLLHLPGLLDTIRSPYNEAIRYLPLATPDLSIEELDGRINFLLFQADNGFPILTPEFNDDQPFFDMAYRMLKAHACYKAGRKDEAFKLLAGADQTVDWVVAGQQWLNRRKK